MPRIAMLLEYDGAGFSGWQVQPEQRTIQGELERVIEKVLRHKVRLIPSGRTDAGVHARGQVASFSTPLEDVDVFKLQLSISALLRGEVSVLKAGYVDESFHPRKAVREKRYRYSIERRKVPPVLEAGRVWHVHDKLDVYCFKQQAEQLLGTHDFASFRAAGCQIKSTEKTIYDVRVEERGTKLYFTVVGSGFLKHMVRIIVGTLVDISRGSLELSVSEILDYRDRTNAGITAPAHGLEMLGVSYLCDSFRWLDVGEPVEIR